MPSKFYQKYKHSIKKWQDKNKSKILERIKIRHLGNVKYNGKNKERIRNRIIEEIQRENINSVLTLESPNFFFSKLIPDKNIIVFENNEENYKSMLKRKTSNVSLYLGDVANFNKLNSCVDMVYLDFCQSFLSCKETIFLLKETISKAKLIAFTFCVRGGTHDKDKSGDYQFYLINQIQSLTGLNLKAIYGEGYSDSGSIMFTCLFKNMGWINES